MNKFASFVFICLLSLLFVACQSDSGNKTNTEKTTETGASEATKSPATNHEEHKHSTHSNAQGIDISQFQGDEIAMLNEADSKLSFIICKATEGITYTDPEFRNNWKEIPSKGFVRGAYHFYRSADDPVKQADHFVNAIKDLKDNDIPPIVDFEGGGIDKSQSVELIQENLHTFLNTVQEKLNRKPMIYTDMPSGNKYLNASFSDYALWIALYVDEQEPQLPKAWEGKTWKFWQKTSHYKIDGKNNDFDMFNGSLNEMKAFIQQY